MRNATRIFAATFGAVMALAGIEHGVGEILQGNVPAPGVMIQSWPEAAFFRSMSGEPAMTIFPNMLLTGILAVSLSLALLLWSVLFVQRRYGGWVMIALSLAMLLAGGGIFPPVFGILIGLVATRIHTPVQDRLPGRESGFRRFLRELWPYAYAVALLAWLAVMPVGYLFGVQSPLTLLAVLLLALGAMTLTAVSGWVRDSSGPLGSGPLSRAGQTPAVQAS